MDEQVFEDFLLDKVNIKRFVDTVFIRQNDKPGDFILTRNHLLRLCNLVIEKNIAVDFLTNISDHLMVSDYFSWDRESTDGNIVSETIFEWANPDINYEINDLNLQLWKEYLETGEHKLEAYNDWNSHIQQQKDICAKVGSAWRPVNPEHKIGVAGNLNDDPFMHYDIFLKKERLAGTSGQVNIQLPKISLSQYTSDIYYKSVPT